MKFAAFLGAILFTAQVSVAAGRDGKHNPNERPSKALVPISINQISACKEAMQSLNPIKRLMARKEHDRLLTQYHLAVVKEFPRLTHGFVGRDGIFERLESAPHDMEKSSVLWILRTMSEIDPAPDLREKALAFLADPPTWQKLIAKQDAAFAAKAPQRALIFESLGFWGAEEQSRRMDALRVVAKRALWLNLAERENLEMISKRDENPEVKKFALQIAITPVQAWYETWERHSSTSAYTGIVEKFERDIQSLNELEKAALLRLANHGVWGIDSLTARVRELTAKLFLGGPYR